MAVFNEEYVKGRGWCAGCNDLDILIAQIIAVNISICDE